jgi:hypothetical protein
MDWKRALLPLFRLAAKPGIGLPHMYDANNTEEELMLAGAKPVMIGNPEFLTDKFKMAINRGNIVVAGTKEFPEDNGASIVMSVYALKDKADSGKELFQLFYETDEPTSAIDDIKMKKRIGEILGYTQEDTAFFVREGIYANPWIRSILMHTADLRRWARKEVMLMDAQDKTKPEALEL